MNPNMLLISNSKHSAHPGKYLAYCEAEVKAHLTGVKTVLFIPYAEPGDMDKIVAKERQDAGSDDVSIPSPQRRYLEYTKLLQKRFAEMGFYLESIEDNLRGPVEAIQKAQDKGSNNDYRLPGHWKCGKDCNRLSHRPYQA